MIELRLGDWRDVLASVDRCAVIISDPPYSARTHAGFRSGTGAAGVSYDAITLADCEDFARAWAPRVDQFVALFCDHHAYAWHELAWSAVGWVSFAPVGWLPSNPSPRRCADGPASACEWLFIARPRSWPAVRRSRPGRYWYAAESQRGEGRTGAKDPQALAALVRDYTRPADLVVDPFAGTASVAQACIAAGRRYVGAEVCEQTHALGVARIAGRGQRGLALEVGA